MKHILRITTSFVLLLFAMSTYAANNNDKCTIYFNDNGGSGGPGTQIITNVKWSGYVSFNLSSSAPTRTAYTFNNWLLTSWGGGDLDDKTTVANTTVWTPGSSHKVSGYYPGVGKDVDVEVRLSARWNPISYTITYNGNGGTPSKSSESYTIETSARTVTATRTGYTFAGWTVLSNSGNWSTSDNISSSIPSGKYGNVTLVAKWTPNNYTVIFDGNGKTKGSMGNKSMTYDTESALPTNGFGREFTVTFNANGGVSNGSETAVSSFNGWATTPSGAKVYNDGATVKNLTATAKGTVTLYAKWIDSQVTLPSVSKDGYALNGWYTSASGGTKVGMPGDKYTPTSNTTIYAQWRIDRFSITIKETGLQDSDNAVVTVAKSGSATPLYTASLSPACSEVTISGLNSGTYIIRVADAWAYSYTVDESSYTKNVDADTTVTFAFTQKTASVPEHSETNIINWK